MASILIAEDHPGVRAFYELALSAGGHTVTLVCDGREAFDAIQHNDFDLLITDGDMPKMDGFELFIAIRSLGITIPIIMISGLETDEHIRRLAQLQFDWVLPKPAELLKLLDTVKSVLTAATQ